MSNNINNLPYANPSYPTPDASTSQGQADSVSQQGGDVGQVQQASAVLQQAIAPFVATALTTALGANAYGSVNGAGTFNVGPGQVLTPASTMASPDAQALASANQFLSGFTPSAGPASSPAAYASVYGAENGGGLTAAQLLLQQRIDAGNAATNGQGRAALMSQEVQLPAASVPHVLATDTTPSTDAADAGPTVSGRTPEQSSISSDFADQVTKSTSDQGSSKCRKLKNGETDNSERLQKLGFDKSTANRMAQMLNSDNKELGVDGMPRQNIINLMAVLAKLKDAGQDKGEAAGQVRDQLKTILGDAKEFKSALNANSSTIKADDKRGTDFIGSTNQAAAYVTAYGLNPQLTKFEEPKISTTVVKGEPWPD